MEKTEQTKPGTHHFSGQTLLAVAARVEEALLSLLLTVMILLACYQIALRWFTSGGLPWIDPLLRYLVLWGGLLGAVLATSRGNHISLDVVSYLVPDRVQQWLKLMTCFFSTIVSVFLFRAALLFIQSEIEFGGNSLFGLPTWVWNLIFPLAFGMICLHFALAALLAVRELIFIEKVAFTGDNTP